MSFVRAAAIELPRQRITILAVPTVVQIDGRLWPYFPGTSQFRQALQLFFQF